jgi:hypothetical protein
MEDQEVHTEIEEMGSEREVDTVSYVLSQRIQMVGWREHETLLAEGHYRCPHCRRTDTLETCPPSYVRR